MLKAGLLLFALVRISTGFENTAKFPELTIADKVSATKQQVLQSGVIPQRTRFPYRSFYQPQRVVFLRQSLRYPFQYRPSWVAPRTINRRRRSSITQSTEEQLKVQNLLSVYYIAYWIASIRNQATTSTTVTSATSPTFSTAFATTKSTIVTTPPLQYLGTSDSDCESWASWTSCKPESARYRARFCFGKPEVQSESCVRDCTDWSDWTECATDPILIDETRTRDRICEGKTEEIKEPCNKGVTVGMLNDGWYRAGNGYEYLITSDYEFADAITACPMIDSASKLASVAARDETLLRTGLDYSEMITNYGGGAFFHLGATRGVGTTTFTFLDEMQQDEADFSTWGVFYDLIAPAGGECLYWVVLIETEEPLITTGFLDFECDVPLPALCERSQ